jgi:hypothetical protein
VEWLTRGWDQGQRVAVGVGLAAGVVLALLGMSGLAEIGAVSAALMLRWGLWQIPPPGRSKAPGSPDDAGTKLVQLAVVVLLVTLVIEIVVSPFNT